MVLRRLVVLMIFAMLLVGTASAKKIKPRWKYGTTMEMSSLSSRPTKMEGLFRFVMRLERLPYLSR